MEAEEPSLYLQREKLALQFAINLIANPLNLTFKVTFPSHISEDTRQLHENKPKAIKSFGLRIEPLLQSGNINQDKNETHSVSEIASWCIRKPTINLSLHSEKKSESNPHLLKQNFYELESYYSDHEHIYTDGSKDEEKVGCAAAKYDDCKTMCIPDGSSVFTAEAKAIDLALDFVKNLCLYRQIRYFFRPFISFTGIKSYILKKFTNPTSFIKAS